MFNLTKLLFFFSSMILLSCGQKGGKSKLQEERTSVKGRNKSQFFKESTTKVGLEKLPVTDFPKSNKVKLTEIDGTKREFLIRKVDHKRSLQIIAEPLFPHKRYHSMLKSARFYTLELGCL